MTKPLLALLLCVPLSLFCGCSDSDTNSPAADGEGLYDVTVVPTAGSYSDTTLADLPVTAMQHTDLGLIELAGIFVEPPAQ